MKRRKQKTLLIVIEVGPVSDPYIGRQLDEIGDVFGRMLDRGRRDEAARFAAAGLTPDSANELRNAYLDSHRGRKS